MNYLPFLASFWALVLAAPNVQFAPGLSLHGGTVRGNSIHNGRIQEYLGLPFAQPPVGDLRWAPPQTLVSVQGRVYNATTFRPGCYGPALEWAIDRPQSEDCLYINVWTSKHRNEKRPVMVWIYGGGFEAGDSATPLYNGTYLAQHGVVVVSFNYRAGVLGFLALAELDTEAGGNSGNFGLQDQLAALKWVQMNIHIFGGDPDNVTLFGESSGSISVSLLMASNLSTGLFHKAIMESGGLWSTDHGSISTFQEARARGAALLKKTDTTCVADLRALSASTLQQITRFNTSTDPSLTGFSPSIDNFILVRAPDTTFARGLQQRVALLAGFNAYEESLFLRREIPHSTIQEYRESLEAVLADRWLDALAFYPGNTVQQVNISAGVLIGDLVIRSGTFNVIDWHATAGHENVFAYYFSFSSPFHPAAAHTSEVNYVFGNLDRPNPFYPAEGPVSERDTALSAKMMAYWTNFAKHGDPNGDNLVQWPAYTRQDRKFLALDEEVSSIAAPDFDRYLFLRSFLHNGVLPTRWRSLFHTGQAL